MLVGLIISYGSVITKNTYLTDVELMICFATVVPLEKLDFCIKFSGCSGLIYQLEKLIASYCDAYFKAIIDCPLKNIKIATEKSCFHYGNDMCAS